MQTMAGSPGFHWPCNSLHSRSMLKTSNIHRHTLLTPAASSFTGAGPLAQDIKVVGMGGLGVDYLASVASYPRPDQKLRTEQLEVQGGGNAGNAVTAAARLGLKPMLVTKIGDDGLGDGMISELQHDGVDTSHIIRAEGHPSPFTYIIVDREGGTRTCIHTPGAALLPYEMTQESIDDILKGAALVYFDGRLTEAALLVAAAARQAGIPILVEGERLRPGLDELLEYADYVVTSAHFPQDWTGEGLLEDAVLATVQRLPNARVVITTLGSKGCVMVEKLAAEQTSATTLTMQEAMQQLGQQLQASKEVTEQTEPACVTRSGLPIRAGSVASTGPVQLTYSDKRDTAASAANAQAAAEQEAAANGDAGNGAAYKLSGATAVADKPQPTLLRACVTMASIASLDKEQVVDTTGAGDAFIGSVVYGIVTGMSHARILQLAGLVAAAKCTQLGARPGLPGREHLAASIL